MKIHLLVVALCLLAHCPFSLAATPDKLQFEAHENGVPPAPEFWKAVEDSSNVSSKPRVRSPRIRTVPDSIVLTPPSRQNRPKKTTQERPQPQERKLPQGPEKPQTPDPSNHAANPNQTKKPDLLEATPVQLRPQENVPLAEKPATNPPATNPPTTNPQPTKSPAPTTKLAATEAIEAKLSFRPTNATETPKQDSVATGEFRIEGTIPHLQVVTRGPKTIIMGRDEPYTLSLTNPIEHAIENVEVRCVIPHGVQITENQPTSGIFISQPELVTWRIPSLPASSTEQLRLNLKPTTSQPFDLQVFVAVPSSQTDKHIRIVEPKLKVSIDGPTKGSYGETKTWALRVNNAGTGTVSNVDLQVFSNATPLAKTHIKSLAPGETRIADLELVLNDDGLLPLKATARGDLGTNHSEEFAVEIGRPIISMDLDGPGIEYAGLPTEYRIRLANQGNADAQRVVTRISLPAGVHYVDGLPNATLTDVGLLFTVDTLPAAQKLELPFRLRFMEGGIHQLSAMSAANNAAEVTKSIETEAVTSADLKLEVVDSVGPRPVGTPDEYVIHVTNRGTAPARNIRVVAVCSPEVEPVDIIAGTAAIQAGQIFFRPIEELSANHQITYRVRVRATEPGTHAFRVVVNSIEPDQRLSTEESTTYVGRSARASVARRDK